MVGIWLTSLRLLPAARTDPGAHGCFDLVVLLALHTKGSDSRKAVEACLKKKLLEGAATPAWLNRALTSHQVRQTARAVCCTSLVADVCKWATAELT